MSEHSEEQITKMNEASESFSADSPPPPPSLSVLDYVLYPFFLLGFILILLVFEVIQRVAFMFGRNAHDWSIRGLNFSLVTLLRLIGTCITVQGASPLQDKEAAIIVSNHQSMFDIPILHNVFHVAKPRFVAKVELAHRIPSVSFNLRNGLSAIIDRSDAKQALAELAQFADRAAEYKFAAVIFPEGTRAKEGKLKFFRPAGLSSLVDKLPEVKIIPVTIDGSWKLAYFKKGPVPIGQKISVVIGQPIDRAVFSSSRQVTQESHRIISETLTKLRQG